MKVQKHTVQNIGYQHIWDFQTLLNNDIKQLKRFHSSAVNKAKGNFLNHLVFCEHKPVFTLGKSASAENLLLSDKELKDQQIELFNINRGGDITYHGPGQWTVYLIVDLEQLYRDVHLFVRNIEEAIIRLLASYGLEAFRLEGYTGVWLGTPGDYRKICAIGVHLSRWVSMHGLAFNINTDLDYFTKIIPCGIAEKDKSVTSLANELGTCQDMTLVALQMAHHFSEVFEFDYIND